MALVEDVTVVGAPLAEDVTVVAPSLSAVEVDVTAVAASLAKDVLVRMVTESVGWEAEVVVAVPSDVVEVVAVGSTITVPVEVEVADVVLFPMRKLMYSVGSPAG